MAVLNDQRIGEGQTALEYGHLGSMLVNMDEHGIDHPYIPIGVHHVHSYFII